MATLEELLAEKARRASTKGAATQKVGSPAGQLPRQQPSNAQLMEALATAEPSAPPEASLGEQFSRSRPTDMIRSGLEGATLGASNAIGSGVATAMALPQALRQQAERQRGEGREPDLMEALRVGIPETYRDIRGSLQLEEDEFRAENEKLANVAQGVGAGTALAASAGPAVARGLSRAAQAAMQRGAARVGGGAAGVAGKAAQGARTASRTKPRFKANPDGTYTPLNRAANKVAKKSTRKQAVKDGTVAGAEWDLAEAMLHQEHTPDTAALGAISGAVLPSAVRNLVVNTPVGRLLASRALSKVVGQKYQPYIYTGMHPATRRGMSKFVTGGK